MYTKRRSVAKFAVVLSSAPISEMLGRTSHLLLRGPVVCLVVQNYLIAASGDSNVRQAPCKLSLIHHVIPCHLHAPFSIVILQGGYHKLVVLILTQTAVLQCCSRTHSTLCAVYTLLNILD